MMTKLLLCVLAALSVNRVDCATNETDSERSLYDGHVLTDPQYVTGQKEDIYHSTGYSSYTPPSVPYQAPTNYQSYPSNYQKPLTIIAPQVNEESLADWWVAQGATGLEVDLNFDSNGNPTVLQHDEPYDCAPGGPVVNGIDKYFTFLALSTLPGSPIYKKTLAMTYLVPSISNLTPAAKEIAGRELFVKIWQHIYQSGDARIKIKCVVGIGTLNSEPFVKGFMDQEKELGLTGFMAKRIGFDFWQTETPIKEILAIWQRQGVTNVWHANGALCEGDVSAEEVAELTKRKVQHPQIAKIYYWSIQKPKGVEHALQFGLDGVQTTQVRDTHILLQKSPWNKLYRVATQDDDLWARYPTISYWTPYQLPIEESSSPPYSMDNYPQATYQPVGYSTAAYQPISVNYPPAY